MPYDSDLMHAMEIAEPTLREDEFIYEGKIIRLIRDEGPRGTSALTIPFPIVIFRVNLSPRVTNKQPPDPSDCKSGPPNYWIQSCEESSRHQDYYFKHTSIVSDFISRHRPKLTGFVFNTAALLELSHDSATGRKYICSCAHNFISHIRRIVQDSRVYTHYTRLTKETCHQSHVVRDFVNFIFKILDDALDQDVTERPSENGIGKAAFNHAVDSLPEALPAEFPILRSESPVLRSESPLHRS